MRYKPRPWRPAKTVTPIMVANIEGFFFFTKDRVVTLQEVANQSSVNKVTAYQILHEKNRYEQGKC